MTTDHWPVVLLPTRGGAPDPLGRVLAILAADRADPLEIVLQEAEGLRASDLLRAGPGFDKDEDEDEDGGVHVTDESLPNGEVPPIPTDVPDGEVVMAQVPGDGSAEVPGVLGFGGFNGCPAPAETWPSSITGRRSGARRSSPSGPA